MIFQRVILFCLEIVFLTAFLKFGLVWFISLFLNLTLAKRKLKSLYYSDSLCKYLAVFSPGYHCNGGINRLIVLTVYLVG